MVDYRRNITLSNKVGRGRKFKGNGARWAAGVTERGGRPGPGAEGEAGGPAMGQAGQGAVGGAGRPAEARARGQRAGGPRG
jgi:hypothetical protein